VNHADYPWFATLTKVANHGIGTCGVSMINPTWGVTACNCIIKGDYSGYYPGAGGQITYGCNNVHQSTCQRRDIKRFVPHPCYTISCCDDHDDICLVELTAPVVMSRYAKLSGVHGTLNTPAGTPVTLVGSGRSESGSGVMRKVEVQTITPEQCKAHEPYAVAHNLINFSNVICTAGTTGKDSCGGDSGSPVVGCYGGEDWVLGVLVKGSQLPTSGPSCGANGRYAVYTKMEHFAEFVQTALSGATWACANCHKQGGSSCSSLLGHTPVLGCNEAPTSTAPSPSPTIDPTKLTTAPTNIPSGAPTQTPTPPTKAPTQTPTEVGATWSSISPTTIPTGTPTTAVPTGSPSSMPIPENKTHAGDVNKTGPDVQHVGQLQTSVWVYVGAAVGGCVIVLLIAGLVTWKCRRGCFTKGYDVVGEDLEEDASPRGSGLTELKSSVVIERRVVEPDEHSVVSDGLVSSDGSTPTRLEMRSKMYEDV